MAVKSLDESNRLFAVEIDMENRSPDEIRIIVSDLPDFIERKDADRFILALSENQAVVQFNHLDPP